MDDIPPPRRVRRQTAGERSFPLIPILICVVVLGLAFGAGLSVLMQRNSQVPVAIVTAAPVATPGPTATAGAPLNPNGTKATNATPAPSNAPIHVPSPGTNPSPRSNPSIAAATPASHRVAVVNAPVVIGARMTPEPAATSADVRRPLSGTTVPSYAVTAMPAPVVRSQATDEADSDFARLGAGVVRFYLSALARGDDTSARTVLDGPRGSPALRLSEKEFADSSLRIMKLDAHGISDSATVNVDLSTSKGAYFEQFSLRRLPTGAAVIIEHTFIRP